jgi:hypothetical protein
LYQVRRENLYNTANSCAYRFDIKIRGPPGAHGL